MTSFDLEFARQDHFALFGLPKAFAIDGDALEVLYRDVQARVHPDKHAHLGDTERRAAMQWSTQVNDAYRTLRDPLLRARYLLHLAGALGVPTLGLLAHRADWRWMIGREDCPWYPGMRLIRQPRPGDWAAVMERVVHHITALAANRDG